MTSPVIRIRRYIPADAGEMALLFYAAVHEVATRRYTAEQAQAWAPAPPDPAAVRERACDGRITRVALDEAGRVAGYGDLEPSGHIDHLYCRPDVVGTGVGGRLLDHLMQEAASAGLPKLFAEASELARPLFERRSFVVVRRREFALRGVAIHNYLMEGPLP